MSDGNRDAHTSAIIIGVVSFLIIFGLIGYAKGFDTVKRSNAEIAAKIHHEDTENRISRNCTSIDSAALAQCIERQIKTSGEYQRAEQDIYAQQSMAEWAKWLFFLTTISTAITGLVGIVVWQTLKVTTDTVGEMSEANHIMRNEQRPWLIHERELGCHLQVNAQRIHLKFNSRIQNVGKSPAFSVRTKVKVIKCERFTHFEQLNEFIEHAVGIAKTLPTNISIFPSEEPEFSTTNSMTHIRDRVATEDGDDAFMLFYAVSYRLWNVPDAELGFDICVYEIVENDERDASTEDSHLLIRYRHDGQTT
jgi:hypothetical protein